MHIAIALQFYWLSRDILNGDGSCKRLSVPLNYPPMRVPGTLFTSQFAAEGRLCTDFAQIYFPSQNRTALRDAYSRSTTLNPLHGPSRYPPLLHFICSHTICRLQYGPACLAHLLAQTCLFLGSFAYAFFRLGVRKYLLPSLLLVNTCLFLTPVGLSFFERGQFSLYVALCYLWLMLAVVTGDKRYAVIAALFAFVKWTSFPFIFVVLSVYLMHSRNRQEIMERLVLASLFCLTIMLLFLSFPRDGMIFLKELFVQELTFTPVGITLLKFLPRFAVKAIPFVLVGAGFINRLCFRRDTSYLMPFFAGSATMLVTYPTWAFDYSVPCLTSFVPCMIYWANLSGVDRFNSRIVSAIFFMFLLLASYACEVFNFPELEVTIMYLLMALILLGTPFLEAKIDNKKSIGKTLHKIPIASLVIYTVFIMSSEKLPSYNSTYIFLATVIVIEVIAYLLTEGFTIKRYESYNKSENPCTYWLHVVLLVLISLFLVSLAH